MEESKLSYPKIGHQIHKMVKISAIKFN